MKSTFTHRNSLLFKSLRPLVMVLLIVSCRSQSKEEAQLNADSLLLSDPNTEELNSSSSVLLNEILGTNREGVFRGVTFGEAASKIKESEKFELFEEVSDHLGYTHDTEQLETIDILYHLSAETTVNKITVDVYLNSTKATQKLWKSGQNHFTSIYGNPEVSGKVYSWTNDRVILRMEDVSQGKDFGLKLQFLPSNKAVLATK